jgi:ubiquinone biosynthesis protein
VLVMEEVIGTPVDDAASLTRSGATPRALAADLLNTMLDQMFQKGVFHADPHPGNVFVTEHGKLALIDFGSVGVLTPRLLESLREMAMAAAVGDPTMLRRAVVQIAGAPPDCDLGQLEDQLGLFLSVNLSEAGSLSPDLFGQMLDVMRTNGLAPPPGLTLLTRALVTLEGTLRVIDTTFSMADETAKVAHEWADEAFDGDDWQGLLQDELVKSLPVLRTMPDRVDRLLTLAGSGGLSIRTRVIDNPDDRLFVARWVSRALFAGIGSMGLVAAAIMLLAATGLPTKEPLHDGLLAAGIAGFFVSSVLLMRAVAGAFRDSDV